MQILNTKTHRYKKPQTLNNPNKTKQTGNGKRETAEILKGDSMENKTLAGNLFLRGDEIEKSKEKLGSDNDSVKCEL